MQLDIWKISSQIEILVSATKLVLLNVKPNTGTAKKMVALKELDEKLLALQRKITEEERDWREEQRKLFEFEDKFLRDTLGEGNMVAGWGESKSAPLRFRNAAVRKKKRERQESAAAASVNESGSGAAPATLNDEERLKVDLHRFASYSSVTSPAEPIFATLRTRKQQIAVAPKAKKAKK